MFTEGTCPSVLNFMLSLKSLLYHFTSLPLFLLSSWFLISAHMHSGPNPPLISQLILWSAVPSKCQSDPLVWGLILALPAAAELLWTVADGWRAVALGGGEVEVLSLESGDSTETCEGGGTVLNLNTLNIKDSESKEEKKGSLRNFQVDWR